MFIDAHAHLDSKYFDEPVDEVIDRATSAGVSQLIVVGCGVDASENAVRLAKSYPGKIFASVGVHPHDAAGLTDSDFARITELASLPEVVAVGETGLDYHYDYSPRDIQRSVFHRFLDLAAKVGKPAVIHTREAEDDTMAILRERAPLRSSGQLHCFTGSMELASLAVDLGMFVSLAGTITFANADRLRGCVRELPLDRLLIETDCPYMTPAPFRGRKNEPMLVPVVAGTLASVKGISLKQAAVSTTSAARRLFGLPTPREQTVLSFAAGADFWIAVHNPEVTLEGLQKSISSLQRSKLKRLVPFVEEGAAADSGAMEVARGLAAETGLPLAELPETTT